MTRHRSNKRTYSETPTRALDFTKPSLSLQDKEPITHPSYTSNKHHPRATPHAQLTRAERLVVYQMPLETVDVCKWRRGGEGSGILPAERSPRNHVLAVLLSRVSRAGLKKVCEMTHNGFK